jgi:hypothetical protein
MRLNNELLYSGIKFPQSIDHQKDVTQKVAKAKVVLATDELTSTTKTKAKPEINKNEATEKVNVILYYFWQMTSLMNTCCFLR